MGGFRRLRSFIVSARFPSNGHVGRAQRSERGAASVEFASTLPLLILILLGTIDFGRFAYAAIAVTNAARTGAAFCNYVSASACNSSLNDTVENKVIESAGTLSIPCSPGPNPPCDQIQVTFPAGCSFSYGSCLQVGVTYPFTTLLPIPQSNGSGDWTWAPVGITIVRFSRMQVGLN